MHKNLIFDLSNVLIKPESHPWLYIKKNWKFLFIYIITFHNPFKLKKRLFEILNILKPTTDHITSKDPTGQILPQYIYEWLLGTKSSEEITQTIITDIQQANTIFSNNAEKKLITSIIPIIFNSMKNGYLIPTAVNFVQDCKKQGHKLYILSNLDTESLQKLQQKNKNFFDLFNGIIISGKVHILKPDPLIFSYLLKTYNLDSNQCFFFDDQIENIEAAQTLGIYTIYCKTTLSYMDPLFYLTPWSSEPDFTGIKKEFQSLVKP